MDNGKLFSDRKYLRYKRFMECKTDDEKWKLSEKYVKDVDTEGAFICLILLIVCVVELVVIDVVNDTRKITIDDIKSIYGRSICESNDYGSYIESIKNDDYYVIECEFGNVKLYSGDVHGLV
jgi:hypothetical protein